MDEPTIDKNAYYFAQAAAMFTLGLIRAKQMFMILLGMIK